MISLKMQAAVPHSSTTDIRWRARTGHWRVCHRGPKGMRGITSSKLIAKSRPTACQVGTGSRGGQRQR